MRETAYYAILRSGCLKAEISYQDLKHNHGYYIVEVKMILGAFFQRNKTMNKYKFTPQQRMAIWRVYGRKCFYCNRPLTFKEVTIDHIIPESLLYNAERLQALKIEFGLKANFSINDYCNWVPTDLPCNRDKGKTIFSKSPYLIMLLEEAQRKGELARQEEARINKNQKSSEVLGNLEIALKRGIVLKEDVQDILSSILPKQEPYEPIIVTFGLNIDKMLRENSRIKELPTDYPSLCDWLEKDLIKLLSSLLTCSFYYPEHSQRNGETLSVKLAFLQLNFDEFDNFKSPWWEILEIQYYSEVYGRPDWTHLRFKNKIQNAPIISDSEFIGLLNIGGMLTGFRQVTKTDYRAVALSQDYMLYQSDSYYDLDTWREVLELASIEDWEIEQALEKVYTESI